MTATRIIDNTPKYALVNGRTCEGYDVFALINPIKPPIKPNVAIIVISALSILLCGTICSGGISGNIVRYSKMRPSSAKLSSITSIEVTNTNTEAEFDSSCINGTKDMLNDLV